jgi:hypothetical protein
METILKNSITYYMEILLILAIGAIAGIRLAIEEW